MKLKLLIATIIAATSLTGCLSESENKDEETKNNSTKEIIESEADLMPKSVKITDEQIEALTEEEKVAYEKPVQAVLMEYMPTPNPDLNPASIIKQISGDSELTSFSITPISDNGDTIDVEVQPLYLDSKINEKEGLSILIKGTFDTFTAKPGTNIYTIKKALILEANTLSNVEVSISLQDGTLYFGDYHAQGKNNFKEVVNNYIK